MKSKSPLRDGKEFNTGYYCDKCHLSGTGSHDCPNAPKVSAKESWEDNWKCDCRGHKEMISTNDCICSPDDAEDLSTCRRTDGVADRSIRDDLFSDIIRFQTKQLTAEQFMEKILSCKKLKDYLLQKEKEALVERIPHKDSCALYQGEQTDSCDCGVAEMQLYILSTLTEEEGKE